MKSRFDPKKFVLLLHLPATVLPKLIQRGLLNCWSPFADSSAGASLNLKKRKEVEGEMLGPSYTDEQHWTEENGKPKLKNPRRFGPVYAGLGQAGITHIRHCLHYGTCVLRLNVSLLIQRATFTPGDSFNHTARKHCSTLRSFHHALLGLSDADTIAVFSGHLDNLECGYIEVQLHGEVESDLMHTLSCPALASLSQSDKKHIDEFLKHVPWCSVEYRD